MQGDRLGKWLRVLALVAGVLIVKVTVAVVLGYVDYFPANFRSDFLRGREDYFSRDYQWAFYPHLASGPVSLLFGLVLISDAFRRKFPKWHRLLGRVQVACVLLVVAPSGLWMAYYAAAGPVAGAGFAGLAIATGVSVAMGWRCAVQRRFATHRVWMLRAYLLLCSAVVIRVASGFAVVTEMNAEWFDPLAAWGCWVVPLGVFEVGRGRGADVVGHRVVGNRRDAESTVGSS